MLRLSAVAFAAAFVFACGAHAQTVLEPHQHEDCHGSAGVYLAAQPYIINPAVQGRRDTLIVGVIDDPSLHAPAVAPWRMEIRSAKGELVYAERGSVRLRPGKGAELGVVWDGIGLDGKPVADGEYDIVLVSRVEPFRFDSQAGEQAKSIDALLAKGPPAPGSSVQVVVDRRGRYDRLFDAKPIERPEAQKAASLDSTFPYQFFFGSTHAHTAWSDGGMPLNNCSSGRYGVAGGARPVDAWAYARNTAGLDFLAVVEHNHLMKEACANCTDQGVRDRYAAGFNNAISATVPGSFVALFGMEWGVISGGGHINILNQSRLMAWNGEPHHVLTPQSNYPALYTALRNNQGSLGSYGTFNHPQSTDFGSFVRSADGDAVMRGMALVSGPAFSTGTSHAPGGTRYDARYKQALSYGWRISPEAQQDNHCWNYGNATRNRTVALIPNGTTFNQASLMAAINARRFYASEDRNAQLIFRTTNGTSVMGASFNTTNPSIAVTARITDPDGEGVQKIEIWGGVAGTSSAPGAAPTVQASNTGSGTLAVSLPRRTSGQRWYYYVRAVQADGDVLWSAPIWILWQ